MGPADSPDAFGVLSAMRMLHWGLVVMMGLYSGNGFADDPIWSYGGSENGEISWPYLSEAYAVCEKGTQQSPVDIGQTQEQALPPLAIRYAPSPARVETKDYTLVVTIDGNNTLKDNGRLYRLKELRLHTPGEHHIGGKFWLLELQLLHEDAQGHRLILSVLANEGRANPALQALLDHAGQATSFTFDPSLLLPKQRGYYAYTGSLTIPPCTEGVEWRVFKEQMDVAARQQTAIARFMGRNARMPQPAYMRVIKESK